MQAYFSRVAMIIMSVHLQLSSTVPQERNNPEDSYAVIMMKDDAVDINSIHFSE